MTPGNTTSEVKVLQVVLSLNPGGTERLVCDLVTRLPDVATAVCCLDAAGAWGEQLRRDGTAVSVLNRQPGFHPWLGRLVAAAAHEFGATVIHAHQYSAFVYAALGRAWRPGIPIVFTEHGRNSDAPPSPKRRRINRLLQVAASRVVAVSEDLKTFMVAEGFSEQRMAVVYNGIDIGVATAGRDRAAVRRALDVGPDALVVGTVARFDPVKDLGTLLRATATLAGTRPIVTVLVGDGPERATLETMTDALGIRANVRFLGHRDDARAWLSGCDVFVNCSTSEGVSLTILEAMAAGLPIVATRVGGTPEVLTEACAALIPPRDPAALAAAISEFGNDPARARARGAAARARVESAFTIDRMVRDYASMYRSLSRKGS